MTDISEREACSKRCWWLAAGVGLLVAFLLLAFGIWGLLMSILAGVLVAVIVGYLAMTLLCKDVPAAAPQDNTRSAAAASVAAAPTASGSVSSAVGNVPAGDAGIGAARKASAPVEPEAETAQETPSAPVADTAAVEAAPEQVEKADEAPAAVETPEAAVVPEATSTSTAAPVAGPVETSADGKPALLDAPRADGADDLKRIGGIGPKLEQTLNELGIYHFDQLAALQGDEIEWVDARLRFKGRIQRDDWIGQAKALANDGKAKV
ncbi:50S ribosomal protein L21 [Sulfitobacter sp. DSM 110093]|uniref:NADH:quinone oxidoreductase n=1 Tax=Sulfitobacter sp. DSM 110093 TaxID=2883127 RepID=UPI001FAC166B|nr:NADH:quinone oxidoreductase [Sulfitobacter sp. DSM 110093]UOA31457.1 50S ribosomal protein L21 [Sulfitobacter sp. DSM 110093]